MKKIISVILAVFVSISTMSMVGCKPNNGVKIDETKTQLYVSNYDAGIGRTWIEAIAKSFEEDFASYSFQEGRTGVQVIINHNRTDTGAQLLANIGASDDNVFFTESIDYPAFANGQALDLTSIINEGAITGVDASGNFTRENVTIESKLDSNFRTYLNRGTETNEKYYALPYYLSISGFLYDADLWNEKYYYCGRGYAPSEIVADVLARNGSEQELQSAIELYKASESQISKEIFCVNHDGKDNAGNEVGLSAGPDGKYDTYDDGMPATFEEFYTLMDKMVADGVIPFVWTGKFIGYADRFTDAVWYANEDVENLNAYWSLNGTIDDLVKLDKEGKVMYEADGKTPQTESMTFNGGVEDGYNAQRMLSKYYALQFVEKIATNNDWTAKECYSGAVSHITAQSTFITSVNSGSKRIAMLADGVWWQQESDQTFEIMANKNASHSKYNREFGLLCAPNATIERFVYREQNDIKNNFVQGADCFCVLNNNMKEGSPQLEVAKTFISYVHNDEMMNLFTEKTNISRGLNYEINDETYSKLTPYGKNIIDYRDATNIVYPYTNNPLFLNNYQYLSNKPDCWKWHFLHVGGVGGQDVEHYYPISNLHDTTNRNYGLNGRTYFEGLYKQYKELTWPKLIKA